MKDKFSPYISSPYIFLFARLTICSGSLHKLGFAFYVHVTVCRNKFLCNKTDQMHQFHKFILSWNYMFWTVRLSIIRSLFTVRSALVYVIRVCRQLSSRTRMELQFHPGPADNLSTNLYDSSILVLLESRLQICITVPSWSCSKAIYKPVSQFHPGPARKLSTNLYDSSILVLLENCLQICMTVPSWSY